jgi:6-phosphofructokinase 1
MKRIGILTSGGDAPGMNAAIRALVRSGIYYDMDIYGIRRGYEGLIEGDLCHLDASSVGGIIQRGGTILKTARSRYFMEQDGLNEALDTINEYDLDGIVTIGGDGTLRGALSLVESGVKVIGLPATIDNDLPYSDYSIGFDTAVNTILDAISKIRDTSSSHDRISIIEVMGRRSGQLATHAGITGGADIVLVPEVEVDIDKVYAKIKHGIDREKSYSIIIKAEGVDMPTEELARILQNQFDLESRVVVLGHIQRGGAPTAHDRMVASQMGHDAIKLLKEDNQNKVLGIKGGKIISMGIEEGLSQEIEFDRTLNKLTEILSI